MPACTTGMITYWGDEAWLKQSPDKGADVLDAVGTRVPLDLALDHGHDCRDAGDAQLGGHAAVQLHINGAHTHTCRAAIPGRTC